MLYTAVSLETIYEGWDQPRPPCMEIEMNGVTLMVRPIDGISAEVVRLITADAQQYLNPAYAPGAIIQFTPELAKRA